MLLFTRTMHTDASPREALAYVARAVEFVNANSTTEFTGWMTVFGAPAGTYTLSTWVESRAQYAAQMAHLQTLPGFWDLMDSAPRMSRLDMVRMVVYGTPPTSAPPLGTLVSTTVAATVVDRHNEAIEWAVEISQHVESLTGHPVGLMADLYGAMGTMTWMGANTDAAELDDAAAKIAADPGYTALLEKSRGLVIPGHSMQTLATRVA
jgi:hypothetical protein